MNERIDAMPSTHPMLVFADLSMSPSQHWVERGGRRVELTRREFEVLETFLLSPGRVLGVQRFLEPSPLAKPSATRNAFERSLSTLRRKLEADGSPRLIHTVHGVGYVLRV